MTIVLRLVYVVRIIAYVIRSFIVDDVWIWVFLSVSSIRSDTAVIFLMWNIVVDNTLLWILLNF